MYNRTISTAVLGYKITFEISQHYPQIQGSYCFRKPGLAATFKDLWWTYFVFNHPVKYSILYNFLSYTTYIFITSLSIYLSYLNLHPASEVISQEVCSHRIQHVNLVGLECYRLLIEIIPEQKRISTEMFVIYIN